jgi:two-component system, cell cycle response regulator
MLAKMHFLGLTSMASHSAIDVPVKPRILIADDSRIVRATLIKRIEGKFEFREALDGEQAWETLLIDPAIRVVITDLTMPRLDGYGLLRRIRSSKITRIRALPVVVVSGSDEREERDRAMAAGATDLISKGIDTAQLLSRLDILCELVTVQREFELSLKTLGQHVPGDGLAQFLSPEALAGHIATLLAGEAENKKNLVILHVCVGLRHAGLDGAATVPPVAAVNAVGHILLRSVRQSDHVARTGDAEFTLVAENSSTDSTRCFAQRICKAIVSAPLIKLDRMSLVASCGLFSSSEEDGSGLALDEMLAAARRRARLASSRAIVGVVGKHDELVFESGEGGTPVEIVSPPEGESVPDLALLLEWIKQGRHHEVLPYIGKLSTELQPLLDLMMQRQKD